MSNSNLKNKAVNSMKWTALQKYSTMGIQFVSGIILARLLTPYDYGCIGMLSIFMVLAEVFIDGGFGSALIQKKTPTQDDYSTIFFWNILMAVILYAVLFFSAPLIARFYDIPLLSKVLRVQGIILFIYAMNLIQRNQLRKNLNFKLLSITTITTSCIALAITVFLAYKGFGVWALVAQNIIVAAIPCMVYWLYVRWRPKLVFSKASFKELFSFGFYMFLVSVINRFCGSLQAMLIGKMFAPATLGYYSKAKSTESLASHSVSSIMNTVTYPLYSQAQDNLGQMQNMVKRLTQTLAFITFPMMFILILVAKPVFLLLYSDRWLASVPYFQILCLVGLSDCLQGANSQCIAALGKGKTLLMRTIVNRSLGLLFMVGGLFLWGMKGFMIGVVLFNYWCYGLNISLVSKYVGYKWYRQLLDLAPIAVVATTAFGVAFGVGYLLHLNIYVEAIIELLVYAGIYSAWVLLCKPECFTYIWETISPRIKSVSRKFRK